MGGNEPRKGDPKRAVGYLRVSTDEQELGPEAQRAMIDAWALREGIQIVAWRQEKGVSGGADLANRPELLDAVAALRENNAGVLVVAKRDRMARDVGKAREIAGEDGIVQAAGAVVRSSDGMSDLKGATGRFAETVIDAVAEHERGVVRERTKAALDAKRSRGEAVGPPPYGFRSGPGTRLEPNPDEQAVIREVERLWRADAPEREIARELTKHGFRSRMGTPFSQTQVHRIIRRLRLDRPREKSVDPVSRCAPIRRSVHPFPDLLFDVDLDDILRTFGDHGIDLKLLEEAAQWVVEGTVSLRVISLTHCLRVGWDDRVKQIQGLASGATLEHQRLCAIGYLFLEEACGKMATLGASDLAYAAGVADVAATDRSVFVECGTLRGNKLRQSMLANQRLLVIPYGSNRPEHIVDRLLDQALLEKETKLEAERPRSEFFSEPSASDSKRYMREYVAGRTIVFGYMFAPTEKGKVVLRSEVEREIGARMAWSIFSGKRSS